MGEYQNGSSISGGEGGGMGVIDLAEDRDRWQAFLHVVMSLHVP